MGYGDGGVGDGDGTVSDGDGGADDASRDGGGQERKDNDL